MIGTLRHKIVLIDYTPEKDAVGDWISVPSVLWSGWAGAQRISGNRALQSQQVQLHATYVFRIRYAGLDIKPTTKIAFNNWVFTISEIEVVDERYKYLLITGEALRPRSVPVPGTNYLTTENGLFILTESGDLIPIE